MKPRIARLLASLALALALAAPAGAAVVYLKDGRSFRGTVVQATAADLTLSTPNGTLIFGAAEVSRVDYTDDLGPAATSPPPPPPTKAPAPTYQFTPYKNQAYIDLGVAIPIGKVGFEGAGGGKVTNGLVGPSFGLGWLRSLDDKYALGLSYDYHDRSGNVDISGVPFAVTEVGGGSSVFLVAAKRSFNRGDWVRPYLRAGIGGHYTHTTADAVPQDGFVWSDTGTAEVRRLGTGDHWGFAGAAGVGMDFELGGAGFFALDAGWTGLDQAGYEASAQGTDLGLTKDKSSLNIVALTVRWGWRF